MAFEWSRAGHEIYMYDFPQFDKQIAAITKAGGITSEGMMEGERVFERYRKMSAALGTEPVYENGFIKVRF